MMPMMYTGPLNGMVEVDEIHEYDYGKDGVTVVGVTWIRSTPEEKARTRANLIRAAQNALRKQVEREMEDAK